MRFRLPNPPLIVGLIASLVAHAWLIVPALIAMMRAESRTLGMEARFNPDDFERPEEMREREREPVELGIDAETPSTLTWIGYEKYEEHLARLSEVEQAAFTDEPAGGALATATPAVSEPVDTPQDETQPERSERSADDQAAAARNEVDAAAAAPSLTAMLDWLARFSPDQIAAPFPAQQPVPTEPVDGSEPRQAEQQAKADRESDGEAEPAKASERTPREEPTEPQDESADRPTKQPGEPGAQDVGEQSDKESDPTSVVKVPYDQLQPGKPIARPGLEVKPHRPEFPILTRLTALAGNPLVEIRFGRAGRPLDAKLITSSGNAEVDDILRSSLFRWRAAGKSLTDLEDKKTIDVRVRIIFNPRVE